MSNWRTVLARLPQRIWFRLAVFTVIAVALALFAGIAGPYLPDAVSVEFGQDSVENILQILATSMLAVTTFSLTAMVSAYASAAARGTPRATQLLIADRTSQNALSSFLGSFVFAIVGIVALSTGYYGEQGRVILYFGTLVVIAVVVGTLMQWISHLTGFGRMADVIDRVEMAASDAACEYARHPRLGGAADVDIPGGAIAVASTRVGCLTGISMSVLQSVAEEANLRLHVATMPGVAVDYGTVLAFVEGSLTDESRERITGAFRVENHRTYEQDPRLGFVALAEIASRALSPSTNDPGTAVEVLNAIQRVFTQVLTTDAIAEVKYSRVHVPVTAFADLVEDAFRPIARDGAPMVEVDLRLQSVLEALVRIASPAEREALVATSHDAETRAIAALSAAADADLVRKQSAQARRE
ncbi:DUF2254 domain-containing protein [Demequina aurantiaca]|uniref:DUF2254 domain-containing protein n=1 Tax=Demequina aurantiaca TaxID=676200 RepID=UPI000780A208|nr:DUF2254 domain-containing protein [Demequina aurantiaca]